MRRTPFSTPQVPHARPPRHGLLGVFGLPSNLAVVGTVSWFSRPHAPVPLCRHSRGLLCSRPSTLTVLFHGYPPPTPVRRFHGFACSFMLTPPPYIYTVSACSRMLAWPSSTACCMPTRLHSAAVTFYAGFSLPSRLPSACRLHRFPRLAHSDVAVPQGPRTPHSTPLPFSLSHAHAFRLPPSSHVARPRVLTLPLLARSRILTRCHTASR